MKKMLSIKQLLLPRQQNRQETPSVAVATITGGEPQL